MTHIVLHHDQPPTKGLPRGVLYGAIALVGFTLVAASFTRLSGIGDVRMIETKAVETMPLKFEDRADGSVLVKDASDGRTIYRVAPGTNGFIRGTMRGLASERKRDGVSDVKPFLLIHWTDGTVSLEDPATARKIDLDAFGPTNARAFAQLFADRRHAQ